MATIARSLVPGAQPDHSHLRLSAGRQVITATIVAGPVVGLVIVLTLLWGRAVNALDLAMAGALYVVTGFGITVGFHRCFSHRSFVPRRTLKVVLAIVGSMAVQGSVVSWVATHRRHHMFSDRAGDPHSPHRYGPGRAALVRGLGFAHLGWLFVPTTSSPTRLAPDVLADRDMRRISQLFPLWAVGSLVLPFMVGYLVTRSATAGTIALVWAGLVRMALLHHVTWGVNSLCHAFGSRSFATRDRSTNIRVLALISLGDSWHNMHHAHPSWARHGAFYSQVDPSASLIRLFERCGWVRKVRWPSQSDPINPVAPELDGYIAPAQLADVPVSRARVRLRRECRLR
jgi:stearoyl-CoA desaturase (delta-9 desaturase)